MPPKLNGPVHTRSGPFMDVASCGARGNDLRFHRSINRATCPDCIVRRRASMAANVAKAAARDAAKGAA